MPRMTTGEAAEMLPSKERYEDENDLIDEFCCRFGCSECHGTMPESCEPSGYGCDLMEEWIAKHSDRVGR